MKPVVGSGETRSGLWLRLSAYSSVALAFADASIVVLALPQIVDRLHTSIGHVVWVIAAYNAALIAGGVGMMLVRRSLRFGPALIAGLLLFSLASLGSAAAGSLTVLVCFRVAQGLGGALLLCGSLPFLATATHDDQAALGRWSAAAALGAALGPAMGGLLTEVFSWRAIFLAQAPVAALGALAALSAYRGGLLGSAELVGGDARGSLPPLAGNLALAFVSAGLIGALFLVTVLLINVWGLTPLAAALILTVIPLCTFLAERLVHGRAPAVLGAAGAAVLALGLALLGLVSHRQVGLALFALVLCGLGLGLAFPPLTAAALRGEAPLLRRVARTVAARDAGLLIGLLILTPIFVDRLNRAPQRAIPPITASLATAPIPLPMKFQLGNGLLAANASASQAELPDIRPAFTQAARGAGVPTRIALARLSIAVQGLIVGAATASFHVPLLLCAGFASLGTALLGLWWLLRSRARP